MKKPRTLPIGSWIALAGAGTIVWSGWLLAAHTYAWLKFGSWPEYRTASLIADVGGKWPFVEWAGVQKIINWIMMSGAAGTLFWTGFAIACLGGYRMGVEENNAQAITRAELDRTAAEKRTEADVRRAEDAARQKRKEDNRAAREANRL